MTNHDREQDREGWTKLVADYEASELTQREFAFERGVSFSNLRNWIYRLRRESRPLGTKAPASSGTPRRCSAQGALASGAGARGSLRAER